jgi:hypothetical protein
MLFHYRRRSTGAVSSVVLSRAAVVVTVGLLSGLTLSGCTSGSSSKTSASTADSAAADSTASGATASDSTASDSTGGESVAADTTGGAASSRFVVPAGAVPIEYTFVKDTPLIKETLVEMTGPTKAISMHITNITYGGVVCGFSFTGPTRPDSPQQVTVTLEDSDGRIVSAKVALRWSGDQDQADSTNVDGWNFLTDAQINRNGPGWVVQVGALPEEGGLDRTPPKQAVCELTSETDITPQSGPIGYWAGFAAV